MFASKPLLIIKPHGHYHYFDNTYDSFIDQLWGTLLFWFYTDSDNVLHTFEDKNGTLNKKEVVPFGKREI